MIPLNNYLKHSTNRKKKDCQLKITLQYISCPQKKSLSKEKALILVTIFRKIKRKLDWKNIKRTYKIKIFEQKHFFLFIESKAFIKIFIFYPILL